MSQVSEAGGRRGRLTPELVERWRARLGARAGLSVGAPHREWSGADGLATLSPLVSVADDRPQDFGVLAYGRRLANLSTYCILHSPCRVERTARLIRENPADQMAVLVSTMRANAVVRQGSRGFAYQPGQLVLLNMSLPYRQRCDAVSDPVGMLVPLDLLGKQRSISERTRSPVAPPTLLARAVVAFVSRFAIDTALSSGPVPPPDTEMAAIDLIAAALAEMNDEKPRLEDDSLFVHEAVRDLIERNHRDPDFSPDTIAHHLHLSRRQVYRNFEPAGQSPAALIAARRVETARQLLVSYPGLSIGDVARASGFPTMATFRNRFRAKYGVGPREYRSLVAGGVRVPECGADE